MSFARVTENSVTRAASFVLGYLHALGSSVYLFTVGFLSGKHRPLLRTINRHFGFDRKVVPPRLPTVEVGEVVDPHVAIELREEAAALGNVSLLELVVLTKLARKGHPRQIFEIGTFDGRTTLNLSANAPEARVLTLDLPRTAADDTAFPLDRHDRYCVEKEKSGARFLGSDREGAITQLYGDSANFDYGPYRGHVDFVFVDGAHSYEYVISDSKVALGLLPGGKGTIVWHDYDVWDGVTQALNELRENDPAFAGLVHVKGTSLALLRT